MYITELLSDDLVHQLSQDTSYLYTFQVNLEQSAMEEILKFGEFSSLLNKSHSANSTNKSENSGITGDGKRKEANRDEDDLFHREKDNRGCQVENGQDIV